MARTLNYCHINTSFLWRKEIPFSFYRMTDGSLFVKVDLTGRETMKNMSSLLIYVCLSTYGMGYTSLLFMKILVCNLWYVDESVNNKYTDKFIDG